ncbi:hypothetical protein CHS0354_008849 [Potamilus streckersoni]|uniref:VWFA domain-containing protein n=1 Tax=Potamilus streckersoni TaxID=2493646 RepID=A0AAE0VXI9_9BIVA|nr:hypothetical protein CHS0354_008849 [Potamilus streckersoni]
MGLLLILLLALTCYDCHSSTRNPVCTKTTVCGHNETCMLKELRASDGHHEYIRMCEKQEVCDYIQLGFAAVGKRESEISIKSRDISITCCKTNLCNMPVMSTTSSSTTTAQLGHGHCPRDILFIVDASGSLGPANFQQVLNFIAGVINGLNIGVSENRVAVMTFSSSVKVEWNLNTYADKQSLINATHHIHYTGGETYTHQALQYARIKVFSLAAGDRQHFPNVAIILTDGKSNNDSQTVIEAAALQHVAKVIAIGIGSQIDTNELHAIATNPDQQNVLLARDVHELQTLLTKIRTLLC